MDVNSLVAQAKTNTKELEDQTEVSSGGDFEYETPPAGPAPARFIGYIELGKRKQRPYQGKEKPPAEEVRLVFELSGKKHTKEIETQDGEKKTITNTISVKITKKLNDKAGFTKLFRKMTYGRENITHMAQMLGEAFLINVVHNTVEKDGNKRTYANMKDTDGSWTIGAPVVTDPMSGDSTPVPVAEPRQRIQLLLWDNPTKEQWDSLFIDGTKTVKDEQGKEKTVSKNWLQNMILTEALNIEGSPLQEMLGGLGDLDLEPESGPESGNSSDGGSTPEESETPADGDTQGGSDASDDEDDPLKALGL